MYICFESIILQYEKWHKIFQNCSLKNHSNTVFYFKTPHFFYSAGAPPPILDLSAMIAFFFTCSLSWNISFYKSFNNNFSFIRHSGMDIKNGLNEIKTLLKCTYQFSKLAFLENYSIMQGSVPLIKTPDPNFVTFAGRKFNDCEWTVNS